MDQKTRILMVEDEAAYVAALVPSLSQEGFVVDVARTGIEALEVFERQQPDLVLLDVMLPGMSGLDVCRKIRERSNVPIIMVTARADEADTIVGLELGADDYVTKPYRIKELVARMRTALRRTIANSLPGAALDGEIITGGNVIIDLGRHAVTVGTTEVDLTVKEFGLLEALMTHAGRVLSRNQLADLVWEDGVVGEIKTIDVHIMRLRSKLLAASDGCDCIKTIRGVGYRFEASDPSSIESAVREDNA